MVRLNPELFLADLEAKPAALAALAGEIDEAWAWLDREPRRVLLLGMGSSRYAAGVAALRLRAAGIDAVAEYASAGPYPADEGTLVVAISATGGSRETLDALDGRKGHVALTNVPGSRVTEGAARVVGMGAGEERGGVACRSFQHTLALLLALEARLAGAPGVADTLREAADETAALLDARDRWLPGVLELLDGPHGVYAIAPAARLSSAEQAALMVREGPRRQADAAETGDWAHVDVYLTKTLDYRALLFTGSRYDAQAMEWLTSRGCTVVAVGRAIEGAAYTVRHGGGEAVRLLTEPLVAELVAASWWGSVAL